MLASLSQTSVFPEVELLYDVNLSQLPDDDLVGCWRVESRAISHADPAAVLARTSALDLGPAGRLTVFAEQPETQEPGRWQVQRDERLNRPYLTLDLAGEATRALVTRLRRSPTSDTRRLTLYFLSGMELVLSSTSSTSPAPAPVN